MPLTWLRAHVKAMPALQAEEAFGQAEIISVGGGNVKQADREKIVKRWERSLGMERASSARSIRLTGTRRDLELMGMGDRTVGPR